MVCQASTACVCACVSVSFSVLHLSVVLRFLCVWARTSAWCVYREHRLFVWAGT